VTAVGVSGGRAEGGPDQDVQGGATWFTIDQPSAVFASFATPAITEVGIDLDRRLAVLLDALGAHRCRRPAGPAWSR
jgi:hypothetical protein